MEVVMKTMKDIIQNSRAGSSDLSNKKQEYETLKSDVQWFRCCYGWCRIL